MRGIHRSLMNSPHKDQWRGGLMFYLICTWTNGWVNARNAGDLIGHRAHYDVTAMDWHLNDHHISKLKYHKALTSLALQGKDLPILHNWYHNCWWHNALGRQSVVNLEVNIIYPEQPEPCTTRLLLVFKHLNRLFPQLIIVCSSIFFARIYIFARTQMQHTYICEKDI